MDERFEVGARCARALERILAKKPEFRPQPNVIFDVVEWELSSTNQLTESHEQGGIEMEAVLKDNLPATVSEQ